MGACVNKEAIKSQKDLYRAKTSNKELSIKEDIGEDTFVEILHKDGSLTKYIYNPSPLPQISASETVKVNAETLDQKKISLQFLGSDKVLALKQKVCESFGFVEALIIFQGKVLDFSLAIGNCLDQGSTVDVISV